MTGVTPSAARRRAERETAPPAADDPPVESARLYNQPTLAPSRKAVAGMIAGAVTNIVAAVLNYRYPELFGPEVVGGAVLAMTSAAHYCFRERLR